MDAEKYRQVVLSFPEVTEEQPFGPEATVYKTAGKMFALIGYDNKPLWTNLKCDPKKAEELRDQYACVKPGYHMNKKHWNTVTLDGSVPDELVTEWIKHSFECVLKGFPKAKREALLKAQQSSRPLDHTDKELRSQLRKGI